MVRVFLGILSFYLVGNVSSQSFDCKGHITKYNTQDQLNVLTIGSNEFLEFTDIEFTFININFAEHRAQVRSDGGVRRVYDSIIQETTERRYRFELLAFEEMCLSAEGVSSDYKFSEVELLYSPGCENPAVYSNPDLMRVIRFNGGEFKFSEIHRIAMPFGILVTVKTNSQIASFLNEIVNSNILKFTGYIEPRNTVHNKASYIMVNSVEDFEFLLRGINCWEKESESINNNSSNNFFYKIGKVSVLEMQVAAGLMRNMGYNLMPIDMSKNRYYSFSVLRNHYSRDLIKYSFGLYYSDFQKFTSTTTPEYTFHDENSGYDVRFSDFDARHANSELGVILNIPIIQMSTEKGFNVKLLSGLSTSILRTSRYRLFCSEIKGPIQNSFVQQGGSLVYDNRGSSLGYNGSGFFNLDLCASLNSWKHVTMDINFRNGWGVFNPALEFVNGGISGAFYEAFLKNNMYHQVQLGLNLRFK